MAAGHPKGSRASAPDGGAAEEGHRFEELSANGERVSRREVLGAALGAPLISAEEAAGAARPLHRVSPDGCSAAGSGSRHAPGMPTRLHPLPVPGRNGNSLSPPIARRRGRWRRRGGPSTRLRTGFAQPPRGRRSMRRRISTAIASRRCTTGFGTCSSCRRRTCRPSRSRWSS